MRRQPKLPDSAAAALAIFNELSIGSPVAETEWRDACVSGRQVSASEEPESRLKAFKRAVVTLTRQGLIDFKDGAYFPVSLADYTNYFPKEGEAE